MSDEQTDEQREGQSTESHVIDADDFAKAGLQTEGVYHWTVTKMFKQTKTGKNGDYDVITGILTPFERAIFNPGGGVEDIEELDFARGEFQDFPLNGKGLGRLKGLYKVITGTLPQGVLNAETGRYEIDLLSVAEECVGGTAWNSYTHTKPDQQTRAIYGRIGFNFNKGPKAIKRLLPQEGADDVGEA